MPTAYTPQVLTCDGKMMIKAHGRKKTADIVRGIDQFDFIAATVQQAVAGGNEKTDAGGIDHPGILEIKNDLFLPVIDELLQLILQGSALGGNYIHAGLDNDDSVFSFNIAHSSLVLLVLLV